jgi:hypothetical protein
MATLLHIGVFATGAWALIALTAMILRARAHGRVEYFAPAAGRAMGGVAYAFGPGMSPTAKESAREHLATYFAGVGYHIGIFAGFVSLALLIAGIISNGAAAPGAWLRILQAFCLVGALCGAGLLIKRARSPQLRRLSCPDDYVANLLTTAFAGLASVAPFSPTLRSVWLAESIVLLLYMPIGKIKHCFFFFTTRYYLGTHFGRRNVLPPKA